MSKLLKKITTDAFLYSVLPQLPKVVNILLLPFITPFLSPVDYAVYGTVIAFVSGFEILKSLGLDVVLLNSFFKTPKRYKFIWRKVEAIISIWSLILSLIIAIVIYLILPDQLNEHTKWIVVICVCVPSALFAGLTKVAVLFYQYQQNPRPIVFRSVALGLLAITLNFYLIAVLQLGFMGWFYSSLITGIVLPLTYIHPIITKERLTPIYRISFSELTSMLKLALPTIPHHYSHYFLNFSDRVLFSFLKVPIAQVGIYNIGHSVSYNFHFVTSSMDKVIGPLFHKILSTDREAVHQIRTTVFVLASVYLSAGFLGGIWMKEIFQLLIRNPELSGAYSIAIIILFGYVTRPLYNGAQSFLFFNEKTKKIWWVTFSAGIVNIVLNVLLIPHFGVLAAAINTFVCVGAAHYGIFLLKDLRDVNPIDFSVVIWLTITLLTFTLTWVAKDLPLIYKTALTIVDILVIGGYLFLLGRRRSI
jgi:O-antigen/teichoic acid export membrane protein